MSDLGSDLKIVIVGNSGVGKSNFKNKWVNKDFQDTYKATIVSEYDFKIFVNEDKFYRIQIWDISGKEKNWIIDKALSNDTKGCVFVSDATNIKTREE